MDPIVKRLLENHQVQESEELEDTPEVEEEETLEEDWRTGTIDEKDMNDYEKKIMEDMRRYSFSINNIEKLHPEFKQRIQKIRAEIKRMF